MFTYGLANAVGGREIVALVATDQPAPLPAEVQHRIRQEESEDYDRVARALGACSDVVSIQHRADIWGGPDGDAVLAFLAALDVPAVATVHGLPGSPTDHQRRVVAELAGRAAATVVMTGAASTLLRTVYGVDRDRIEVIPHGTPDLPLVDSRTVKQAVGLAGRDVLLSFGLLGPAKGIDATLEALPAVIGLRPKATFVILGATHPEVLRREGEVYRARLAARIRTLGLEEHVSFVDRFVGRVELTRWLEAADVVVASEPDLGRTASGTLAYAMAAGRPVVSTPQAHAVEALAGGRGLIVPPDAPAALAGAIVGLLEDEPRRLAMARRAHEHARAATWWQVGGRYRAVLARAIAGSAGTRGLRSATGDA